MKQFTGFFIFVFLSIYCHGQCDSALLDRNFDDNLQGVIKSEYFTTPKPFKMQYNYSKPVFDSDEKQYRSRICTSEGVLKCLIYGPTERSCDKNASDQVSFYNAMRPDTLFVVPDSLLRAIDPSGLSDAGIDFPEF